MNEHVDMDYSIRFIGISEDSVKYIIASLGDDNLTITPYYKDDSTFVVVYELNKSVNCELIKQISLEINEGKKDILVSIFTSSDSEIIEIPDYVQKIINTTGLIISISFTVSFEE